MRRGLPGSGFAVTSGRTSYEPPGTVCHDRHHCNDPWIAGQARNDNHADSKATLAQIAAANL